MVGLKTVVVILCVLVGGSILGSAQVQWVPNAADGKVPKDAILAGHEDKTQLYVCRAELGDGGVHPGKTSGELCIVGQKGNAEEKTKFEIAIARSYKWGHWNWDDAFIGGKKPGARGLVDLYVCRALIGEAVVPGKAFRYRPHAGHCFVPFEGSERDITNDFELLRIER